MRKARADALREVASNTVKYRFNVGDLVEHFDLLGTHHEKKVLGVVIEYEMRWKTEFVIVEFQNGSRGAYPRNKYVRDVNVVEAIEKVV